MLRTAENKCGTSFEVQKEMNSLTKQRQHSQWLNNLMLSTKISLLSTVSLFNAGLIQQTLSTLAVTNLTVLCQYTKVSFLSIDNQFTARLFHQLTLADTSFNALLQAITNFPHKASLLHLRAVLNYVHF